MEMRVSKLRALAEGSRGVWQMEIQFFSAIGIIRYTRGSIQRQDDAALQNFNKNFHQPSISRCSASRLWLSADRFSINPNYLWGCILEGQATMRTKYCFIE